MKTLRRLLTSILVLAGAGAFAATKTETYTVVGYYKGAKPSVELYGKATLAVAAKAAGMVQVTSPMDEPDHRIEVLFTKDSFLVYVDALPLSNWPSAWSSVPGYPVFQGDNIEKAESDRCPPRN